MSEAVFPGNGNYKAILEGWRSGNRVYGRLTVVKTGGSGYATHSPVQYGANIAGVSMDGTWLYDFTQYTSKVVWETYRDVAGPGTYNVVGFADMASGIGRAWPATVQVTVPPNTPAAPTTPSVAWIGTTRADVSWSRNASSVAPYASQQVQRRAYQNGAWTAWATVFTDSTGYTNGGSHAWSDRSIQPNRVYQYRVRALNSAGDATSGVSNNLYTVPAAPTNVKAVREASGSITVSFTRQVAYAEHQHRIQYSTDGGSTWTTLTTLGSNVTSYTWTSPPAVASVVFLVQAVNNAPGQQGHGLGSTTVQSNAVTLIVAPNPPSNLAPNGLAFDADTAQTFTWLHNPVDTSVQSAYEIQYRVGTSGAWTTTGKVTSGTSSRVFPANAFVNGSSYQWQVRTWGAHANPSAWSATATFQASDRPSVTIQSPSGTIATASTVVEWVYSDAEGTAQSAWQAELRAGGVALESLSGTGSASTATFTTRLDNLTAYQVRVRVRDGSGLWSEWDQSSFSTDFASPPVPVLTAAWDGDTGRVYLSVVNPSGTPEAVSNEVQRSLDGGLTWTAVITLPPGGSGYDSTIALDAGGVLYRAVAWSALPSSAEGDPVPVLVAPYGGYWSAGTDFGTSIAMNKGHNAPPAVDLQAGLAVRVLNRYAGRKSPVETVGDSTSREGKVSFLVSSVEERDRAEAMSFMPAPHLVRTPDGLSIVCSISDVSIHRVEEGWYTIEFSVTEVSL